MKVCIDNMDCVPINENPSLEIENKVNEIIGKGL